MRGAVCWSCSHELEAHLRPTMDYMLDLPDYLDEDWLADLERHLDDMDAIDAADQYYDEDELSANASSDWENEHDQDTM